jgi:hypothetical protein
MAFCLVVSPRLEPFPRQHFKAVCRPFLLGGFLRLPDFAGVYAIRQQLTGFIPAFSGVFQADVRIDAKS